MQPSNLSNGRRQLQRQAYGRWGFFDGLARSSQARGASSDNARVIQLYYVYHSKRYSDQLDVRMITAFVSDSIDSQAINQMRLREGYQALAVKMLAIQQPRHG